MYYECKEVVFIPQVTVFLKPETYLEAYRKATENRTTTSRILRDLAEKQFGGAVTHGRKKGK